MSEWIANAADFKPDLILKPIIRELARTQVCFPNLKFLVDRISIVTLPRREQATENEAYRLYLTDGEKSIQGRSNIPLPCSKLSADKILAVLKRKLHKQIHNADVREGSFVILRNYRLEYGKKLGGDGSVM